jgi:phosphate starvation-inducible membrane PsiE
MKVLFVVVCLLVIAMAGTYLMFVSMSMVAKHKSNFPMLAIVVVFLLLMLLIGMAGPYFNPEFFNLTK